MTLRYTIPAARERLRLLRWFIDGVNNANAEHECPDYDRLTCEVELLERALAQYEARRGNS